MFFPKSDFQQKKRRPCQDAYKQSSGVGMHQNPHFQLKPINKWKNLEISIRSTIAIPDSAFEASFEVFHFWKSIDLLSRSPEMLDFLLRVK